MENTDNAFTKFPNDILAGMIRCRFTAVQLTVIMYVVRKVNGWRKVSDAISITKIAKESGYSRRAIINAVSDLEKLGVLYVERNGPGKTSDMRVSLPENWDKPVNHSSHVNNTSQVNATSQGGVNHSSQGGVNSTSQVPVNHSSHTKEIYKETFKENIKKDPHPPLPEDEDEEIEIDPAEYLRQLEERKKNGAV